MSLELLGDEDGPSMIGPNQLAIRTIEFNRNFVRQVIEVGSEQAMASNPGYITHGYLGQIQT